MGADYFFYTEVKVDDRWYAIDPRVLRLPYGECGMKWAMNSTYWNGSRSYFGDAYNKLLMISSPIKFMDTSTEFRVEHLLGWRGGENEVEEFYDRILRVVSFSDLKAALPKDGTYQYHGFVHKDFVTAFEDDEIEDIYDEMTVSPEEYSKLIPEARQAYQYFEWNDPMSWRAYLPVLVKRVQARVNEFNDVNFQTYDDVRVIFYMT